MPEDHQLSSANDTAHSIVRTAFVESAKVGLRPWHWCRANVQARLTRVRRAVERSWPVLVCGRKGWDGNCTRINVHGKLWCEVDSEDVK